MKSVLGNSYQKTILYGSYARGDYRENSDVDIMIFVSSDDGQIRRYFDEICDIAFDYQLEYGVDISVNIKNEEQFNYWLGALPFYDNVIKEGMVLDG